MPVKKKYQTPETLALAIQRYFNEVERTKAKPKMADMAQHLGFKCRTTLTKYAKRRGFEHVMAMARQRIEADRVQRLLDPNENTFAIMRELVNNFGWSWPDGWYRREGSRPRKSDIRKALGDAFADHTRTGEPGHLAQPEKSTAAIIRLSDHKREFSTLKKNLRASVA